MIPVPMAHSLGTLPHESLHGCIAALGTQAVHHETLQYLDTGFVSTLVVFPNLIAR